SLSTILGFTRRDKAILGSSISSNPSLEVLITNLLSSDTS
ncbi:hypothetical protein TMEN_1413, partial [Trichophyton mentagrophytes]